MLVNELAKAAGIEPHAVRWSATNGTTASPTSPPMTTGSPLPLSYGF